MRHWPVLKSETARSRCLRRGGTSMSGPRGGARLGVPALPPRHISRPRLLAALDSAAAKPLILLTAGPGAGKTVLLSDWVTGSEAAVAWITVTPADTEPSRFWRLLRAALQASGQPVEAVPPA